MLDVGGGCPRPNHHKKMKTQITIDFPIPLKGTVSDDWGLTVLETAVDFHRQAGFKRGGWYSCPIQMGHDGVLRLLCLSRWRRRREAVEAANRTWLGILPGFTVRIKHTDGVYSAKLLYNGFEVSHITYLARDCDVSSVD